MSSLVSGLNVYLYFLLFLLLLYFIRHFSFTLNRAFRAQNSLYLGIEHSELPTVSILVPAHNEEAVISDALNALLKQEYPVHLFKVIPVNDRSTDKTRIILDQFAKQFPARIQVFHRDQGVPGKSAALKEVCEGVDSEIVIVFDADYIPAPNLLMNLVTPFIDPEVGAVMGRVVPLNSGKNLLTRLLDLERSAGYQVDQQARMNMALLPQYGGTVGGVRMQALREVGGWDEKILAEDTDVTLRMFVKGWSVVYQNFCECYEEVPEHWDARIKQVRRWARGHNQVMFKQFFNLLKHPQIQFLEKLDAFLLLCVFLMGPLIFLGWGATQILYFAGYSKISFLASGLGAFIVFSALGNFALFFEIGTAAFLDGYQKRIRLLPLGVFFFFVSLVTVSKVFFVQILDQVFLKKEVSWDKTIRFRKVENHSEEVKK